VAQRLLEHDAHLRAACDNDEAILRRVRPFAGLLRRDLRGLPMVILDGALYVTQTSQRRDSGTAYTTRELADEVVRYALEPLVYSPGPAETAEASLWQLRPAREILALRVCDPAVGSGAILVAACRYLAERLVEAWNAEAEGAAALPPACAVFDDSDARGVQALRAVVDHCVYGVDRNPMAVEMAKLSLWLTTLARDRPFTFLDHQVRCGDSLLGITSLEQVRRLHIRPGAPDAARVLVEELDTARVVDPLVDTALVTATSLMAIDVVTMRDVEEKARLHGAMQRALEPLALLSDVVVGAALETAGKAIGEFEDGIRQQRGTIRDAFAPDGDARVDGAARERARADLRDRARYALDTDNPPGAAPRACLHWRMVYPEVFLAPGRTGFDAFVGNPPFRGGKLISGSFGVAFREHLVACVADGTKGHADLIAYFFLRAFDLLNTEGTCGLLATNTVAQGDTREVGLDRLAARGETIIRAVPSEPWPGVAALEIAKVWLRKGGWQGEFVLAGKPVRAITPMLTLPGRVSGTPHRLAANASKSFIGSYVLGMGFVMTPEAAQELIAKDRRNRDVLLPYLNGEDLTSRPDQSASRWVINFKDWPLDRSTSGSWVKAGEAERTQWLRNGRVPGDYADSVAADYPDCLEIVERLVKPERQRLAVDGSFQLRPPLPIRWWQYGDKRPELYATIAGMERVLARARVSNINSISFVPAGVIASEATVVFPFRDAGHFALLQGSFHDIWLGLQASSLRTDTRYTPSDCLETFPFPEQPSVAGLDDIGARYYAHRQNVMTERQQGLTNTYNRFHDRDETSPDIIRLRALHDAMDRAVLDAYGWTDLRPTCEFLLDYEDEDDEADDATDAEFDLPRPDGVPVLWKRDPEQSGSARILPFPARIDDDTGGTRRTLH